MELDGTALGLDPAAEPAIQTEQLPPGTGGDAEIPGTLNVPFWEVLVTYQHGACAGFADQVFHGVQFVQHLCSRGIRHNAVGALAGKAFCFALDDIAAVVG